jgi:hypothetical protein
MIDHLAHQMHHQPDPTTLDTPPPTPQSHHVPADIEEDTKMLADVDQHHSQPLKALLQQQQQPLAMPQQPAMVPVAIRTAAGPQPAPLSRS